MIAKCQVYFAKLFQSPQKDRNTFPGWCTSMMFSHHFQVSKALAIANSSKEPVSSAKGLISTALRYPEPLRLRKRKADSTKSARSPALKLRYQGWILGELPGKLNEHHDLCYFLALNFLGFHACLLRQKAPGNSGKPLLQPWRRIDSRCDTVLQHSVGHC